MKIHSQNSGIHSQKGDSNHYFGMDSTLWEWISTPNEVIPNMTPKRVDFHSAALREWKWQVMMSNYYQIHGNNVMFDRNIEYILLKTWGSGCMIYISAVESQKGVIAPLKDITLRTKRALALNKSMAIAPFWFSNLNGASLYSVYALLILSRRLFYQFRGIYI